ncbi:hypothetical protein KCP70_21710 [Salmonella enterica subsp. enterica]|nr:hypothetical protein KCP70_21710 [Salmonella enterica subsp. enterica]
MRCHYSFVRWRIAIFRKSSFLCSTVMHGRVSVIMPKEKPENVRRLQPFPCLKRKVAML